MKLSKTNSFIKKAKKVHGNRYDYSFVVYRRSAEKVKIRCFKHGIFEQTPNSHLSGYGCPDCAKVGLEGFLNKAKKVHGNRYDYSLVPKTYKNVTLKVDIMCKKHGPFKQSPYKHMNKQGCPRCARELKKYNALTTKSFIIKAKKVHGNRYDYSNVEYKKSGLKVKIICRKHGIFEQTPNNHLMGMNCWKCSNEERTLRLNTKDFIKKARKIHGRKYIYSSVDYKGWYVAVKIKCRKHGFFFQAPGVHLRKKGCPICGRWNLLNTKKFVKKAKKIHGKKYIYSTVDYKNSRTKVKIKCRKHGLFETNPNAHLQGSGCPLCQESSGERKIALFLDSHRIKYIREKTFKKCKNKKNLFFDFYIPSLKTCIEYDGIQHFKPCGYFGGTAVFKTIKKSDAIKNNFCLKNDIRLIRISYKRTDAEITSILEKL